MLRALAPHRFSVEELLKIKAAQPEAAWSAFYQGSPVALEGNILPADKWRYYGGPQIPGKPPQPKLPDLRQFDFIVQSWDGSFKDTTGSDFCAGQVWGCRGSERWMLDYILEKMSYIRFKEAIRQISYKWPKTSWKLIEDKANGPAVISDLQGEISGLIAIEPEGGKIARAWRASSDLAAGNCFIPDPSIASYIGDFVHRCAVFPANLDKPGSDDDIDAFTQMINKMGTMRLGLSQWYEEQEQKLKLEAAGAKEIITCTGPNGEDLEWDESRKLWRDVKTGATFEAGRETQ